MSKKKKKQVRAEFRKSHDGRIRKRDFTRDAEAMNETIHDLETGERVSGKGRLTRKRTVTGVLTDTPDSGFDVDLDVDLNRCIPGKVVKIFGLKYQVETNQGIYSCSLRQLLKSLSSTLQNTVVTGDVVLISPLDAGSTELKEGFIQRVEPRRSILSRTSRGKQQIIASNVDQVLIVASAREPDLKPNLVDRFLLSVEKAGVQPVIVINKIDLARPDELVQVTGTWGQLGYPVLFVSAKKGIGIDRLRSLMKGHDSVVAGQSGVGKSSLLNAVDPGLDRRTGTVSEENQKGRHTTTNAELIPLKFGGHIVDTPGIRSMQLWDVSAEEVEGFFRELRPFVHQCRFPDCSHTHEQHCAVKFAVADGLVDLRRYDSYCQIRSDL